MQRVERLNPNVSPIMDDIDRLYAFLSEPQKEVGALFNPCYDASFEPLMDIFNVFGTSEWFVDYKSFEYPELPEIKGSNLILAFSGGKDSIASAIKYKEMGYNVYLYHMRHINPTFSDEWKCAEELAKLLELPIYFDDIRFKGYHMWTEHPMKNMLIANGALSYGIREGISTKIAFGNYTTSLLEDNVFDRCAGDCVDMWEAYNGIIKRVLPSFHMRINLDNVLETLELLSDRKDLLNASLSCLCRHSLREYRRDWVKNKFGIELFERRCGSCYKCCLEYIYMADHDKMPFSEAYYKYCLSQLYRITLVEQIPVNSVYDVWDNFLLYPRSESKISEQFEGVKLCTRGLKWT